MPAYWVARSKINDPVEYKKYTDRIPAIFAKYGGRVLARGGRFQVMEDSHVEVQRFCSKKFKRPHHVGITHRDGVAAQDSVQQVGTFVERLDQHYAGLKAAARERRAISSATFAPISPPSGPPARAPGPAPRHPERSRRGRD